MRIIRSALVGIVAAVGAAVLSLLAELAVAVASISSQVTSGSGGLGAVSGPAFFPLAAMIGFVAGFYWQFRRSGTRSEPAV
ncbi:MAG TPA: hypothetical protein VES67_22275 [Vicinamibacterales bacterium]|nr:hypothetical protein [Vicinamibacterales bacterium]